MTKPILKQCAAAVLLWVGLAVLCCPAAAAELTATVTDAAGAVPHWLDGSIATAGTIGSKDMLSVATPQPAGGLYVIWNSHPGVYTLSWEGGSRTVGEEGFLHEYISLEQPMSDLTLSGFAGEGSICELTLLEPGELPDYVQTWQPPCAEADLLLMPTHADDELLFFGGTMPYYAGELGAAVQVAYLTNHHTEPYREHERLNGLWTAGVRNYPAVGPFDDLYSDSLAQAQSQCDPNLVQAWQVEQLRRFRPLAVVGHDLGGEYGHGMHMLSAQTLTLAVESAANSDRFPDSAADYGVWDTPKTYLHLYSQNPVVMDWNRPLDAFEGRTAYQVAVEAFAKHQSQQGFQMGGSGVYDCTRFGLYRTTVGTDSDGGDFLENTAQIARSSDQSDPIPEEPPLPTDEPDLEPTPDPTPQRYTLEEFLNGAGLWVVLGVLVLLVLGTAFLISRFPRGR